MVFIAARNSLLIKKFLGFALIMDGRGKEGRLA